MQSSKFALVGTSCVGKTTLALRLQDFLVKSFPSKKIAVVPEAARIYFTNRKTIKPFSYFHQSRIQNLAKHLEESINKKANLILCDRSVIDAAVYVATMGDKNGARKLLKKVDDWILTYKHFFLLDPKNIPYKTDDIRKEKKETREAFHKMFLDVFTSLKLPYTLISGCWEKRLEEMSKIIYKYFA